MEAFHNIDQPQKVIKLTKTALEYPETRRQPLLLGFGQFHSMQRTPIPHNFHQSVAVTLQHSDTITSLLESA